MIYIAMDFSFIGFFTLLVLRFDKIILTQLFRKQSFLIRGEFVEISRTVIIFPLPVVLRIGIFISFTFSFFWHFFGRAQRNLPKNFFSKKNPMCSLVRINMKCSRRIQCFPMCHKKTYSISLNCWCFMFFLHDLLLQFCN